MTSARAGHVGPARRRLAPLAGNVRRERGAGGADGTLTRNTQRQSSRPAEQAAQHPAAGAAAGRGGGPPAERAGARRPSGPRRGQAVPARRGRRARRRAPGRRARRAARRRWARPAGSEASANSRAPPRRRGAGHPVGEAAGGEQAAAESERVGGDAPRPSAVVETRGLACIAGSAIATIVASRTTTNWATQSRGTTMPAVPELLPSNTLMAGNTYPPTAAAMRLDGGHPGARPREHDLRAGRRPRGARRARGARGPRHPGPARPASPAPSARRPAALAGGARAARRAGRAAARARRRRARRRPTARALEAAARAARAAAGSRRATARWRGAGRRTTRTARPPPRARRARSWSATSAELARLHQCAACCWLFLDHSRGAGRRWCSMADCGTEAKEAPLRRAPPRGAGSTPRAPGG